MAFIASYWFVWVLGFIACAVFAAYTQFSFVKRGFNDPSFLLNQATAALNGKQTSIFTHVVKVGVVGALASVFGILATIAIVIHVLQYVRS